jgi:2-amino-4-hydroxy-6-hydroxymethyldihydropteridine diphosphokinase
MEKVYLLLGGNMGDRNFYIVSATQLLESMLGKLIGKSSLYETAPWGFINRQLFLNQVLLFETALSARQVFRTIVEIENQLGRIRNGKGYKSRTIDIDILFYGNEVIFSEDLIIPHPKIEERKFVLEPLFEISPEFIHPLKKISIQELLANCTDQLAVDRIKL